MQDEEAFAKTAAAVESEIAGQAAEAAALKVSSEKVDKEVADLKKAAARIQKERAQPLLIVGSFIRHVPLALLTGRPRLLQEAWLLQI